MTGDGVTANAVTSPYPSNPALLTSGPNVLPKHSYSDFYIEMYLYFLSVVKLLGVLLSLREGERIDFSCSQPHLFQLCLVFHIPASQACAFLPAVTK